MANYVKITIIFYGLFSLQKQNVVQSFSLFSFVLPRGINTLKFEWNTLILIQTTGRFWGVSVEMTKIKPQQLSHCPPYRICRSDQCSVRNICFMFKKLSYIVFFLFCLRIILKQNFSILDKTIWKRLWQVLAIWFFIVDNNSCDCQKTEGGHR